MPNVSIKQNKPGLALENFLTELSHLTSVDTLLAGAACAPYETDSANCNGKAAAVVLPHDTAAVSSIMRAAVRHGIRLIAQGNRSSLVGAAVADGSGTQVIVSLSRMRRIRSFDPLNRGIIVEAGALLSEVNKVLAPHWLHFPIDVGSDPAVGGLIGTNAGGSRLLRHGDVRRNLLGLEVVLADTEGSVLELLAPLRKNNTGVDLKQLFIGTGGAFGIITAAALELQRVDQSSQCLFLALPNHVAALAVLEAFEQTFGNLLCAFEVISDAALQITLRNFPALRHPFDAAATCYALVEISSSMPGLNELLTQQTETLLEQLYAHEQIANAAFGSAESFWSLRDSLPLAIAREGLPLSFDVAFTRSQLPAFRAQAAQWLQRQHPLLQLYDFGHFADGGCHLIVLLPHDQAKRYDIARIVTLRSAIYQMVREHGGSFSAEHGVGPLNAPYYRKYTAPKIRQISATLQQLMDPQAVLGRYRYV